MNVNGGERYHHITERTKNSEIQNELMPVEGKLL